MAEKSRIDLDIWICVAANGDYAVGASCATAVSRFEENHDDLSTYEAGFRLYKLTLNLPYPGPLELAAVVPGNVAEPVTLVVT